MTILAIEDNPISLKMVRTALEEEGYDVIEAANGSTALEVMARKTPDLILQDLMLPDCDGFDLVSKLRGLPGGAKIPILAMTGLFAKTDEMRFADAPFTDYLFKPVEPSVLIATIHSYLTSNQASMEKSGKKQRILLVDDEPAQQKLFATYLSHLGFDVMTAAHQERLTHQLDRHAKLSAQLARRCAVQSAQVSVLASIGENFLEGKTDGTALLSEILAHYLSVMGFLCGAIYLAEPKDKLILSAQIGFPEAAAKSLPNFFGHQNVLRDAMLQGEPLSINFSASNGPLRRILSRLSGETLLISPLRFSREALGVIVLISDRPSLDSDWVAFSRAITNQIGQVIALSQAISRLQYLAAHDSLTDLPNRAYLKNQIQEAIAAKNPIALYLLNLDRFQEINNTLSYRNGNRLLRQIANRLDKSFFGRGVVARLGADEFALLLFLPAAGDAVHQAAREILKILEPLFRLDGLPIAVQASMGIAIAPEHSDDADTLFSYADMARRAAKETGNDYLIYPDRVEPHSPGHIVMLAELREALEQDKLMLYFQPKLSFQTGRTVSVEALLRWLHPKRGWIAPDLFIPVAEKAGVIHSLTLWVLASALRQAQLWRDAGLNIGVAVNVSARDLQDPTFPDFIARVCRSTRTPRDTLTLELTERALMSDPAKTDVAFQRLDEIGVQFSIDDFGTGYSVLSYLQKLPVDEIKIDKSFVSGLMTDSRSEAIVRSIIDLGRNLGFKVVAEGVEDRRTWKCLARLGCDAVQGYYISHPRSPSDLQRWLKEAPESPDRSSKAERRFRDGEA